MRSVVMEAPGKVVVNEVDKPTLLEPTDAIIKLAASCICGSDLSYRGAQPVDHRAMVTNTSVRSSRSAPRSPP